jgi:hypothetical protein
MMLQGKTDMLEEKLVPLPRFSPQSDVDWPEIEP